MLMTGGIWQISLYKCFCVCQPNAFPSGNTHERNAYLVKSATKRALGGGRGKDQLQGAKNSER